MPLILEKAVEADIERMIEVMYRAMSEDPWDRIMFPTTPEPNNRTNSITRWKNEMHTNPTQWLMKVVDTDLNEIIAFARWNIFRQERPESEWKKQEKRQWDEGTNVEAANAFMYAIIEKRQRVMGGKAHCRKENRAGRQCRLLTCFTVLGMLMTHPEHHRRGAGKMLVQQGTAFADDAGLPCYLEGSPAGHRLYLNMGFKDVETLDMDMSKFGSEGIHPHYVMIRPAKVD